MITVKQLRELLADLPDDARVTAYEGEGTGLDIRHDGKCGWIDTGGDDRQPCDPTRHSLPLKRSR